MRDLAVDTETTLTGPISPTPPTSTLDLSRRPPTLLIPTSNLLPSPRYQERLVVIRPQRNFRSAGPIPTDMKPGHEPSLGRGDSKPRCIELLGPLRIMRAQELRLEVSSCLGDCLQRSAVCFRRA